MWIDHKDLISAVVDLCLQYELDLGEERLLSVCGKCGGGIEPCGREEAERMILSLSLARGGDCDDDVDMDTGVNGGGGRGDTATANVWRGVVRELLDREATGTSAAVSVSVSMFICTQCHQPYWWNDKKNSSPARAMVCMHMCMCVCEWR